MHITRKRKRLGRRPLLPFAPPAQTACLQQQIEGAWQITVTFLSGPRQGSTQTAQAFIGQNRLFASVSTSDPTICVLTGGGNWHVKGPKRFDYEFAEVVLDGIGLILYLVHVQRHAHIHGNGTSFDALGQSDIYRLDGTRLATARASVHAIRVIQEEQSFEDPSEEKILSKECMSDDKTVSF